MFLFDIVHSDGKILTKKKSAIIYSVLCILVSLFRNDGYYIIAITTLCLLFKYSNILKKTKIFKYSSIITLIIIASVYNILFPILKLNAPYRESIGVPLQQIAYAVSNEIIDEELSKEIELFVPVEIIKRVYMPMDVDYIKFNSQFNNTFLENNKAKFWKLYIKLFFRYPKDYLVAFLFNNVGYWNYYTNCFNIASHSLEDYYNPILSYLPQDRDITNNVDIIKSLFGISLKEPIMNIAKLLNNCAIYSLIIFIGIYMMIKRNNIKYNLIFIPFLLRYAGLILFAPIAFSSRYIIYMVLFMPLALIIPFIKEKKKSKL
jgi:hypothetical protein